MSSFKVYARFQMYDEFIIAYRPLKDQFKPYVPVQATKYRLYQDGKVEKMEGTYSTVLYEEYYPIYCNGKTWWT